MAADLPANELSTHDLRRLAEALDGPLLTPHDPSYDEARALFNGMTDRRPAAIARCHSSDDVRRCIEFARAHDVPLSVRGGGHNVAGSALVDGGLAIDFSDLRRVVVDADDATAVVQPGATWADVDAATHAHGLATTGGLVSATGIAGFTLGGGFGWLVRKHGLACDNLQAAEVVTADAGRVRVDDGENSDLLWGLRGGGGNFGVVTSFSFRLHPLREVFGGLVAHGLDRGTDVLRFFREFTATAPDELTTMAAILTTPDGAPAIGLAACYAGDVARGEELLAPLRSFGSPLADHFGVMPYPALQTMFDPSAPAGMQNYWKSDFLDEVGDDAIATILEHAASMPAPLAAIHLHHLGGAMARVAPGATAFYNRRAPYLYNIVGLWADPAENDRNIAWVRSFWTAMRGSARGAYVNFMGEGEEPRLAAAYGDNFPRLVALKDKYDPENLFHGNVKIAPSQRRAA